MNNCGHCKFWGMPNDTNNKFRQCTAVIHDDNSATYEDKWIEPIEERTHLTDEERAALIAIRDGKKAVAVDGSGYFAALKCTEDFGCMLFEEIVRPNDGKQVMIKVEGESFRCPCGCNVFTKSGKKYWCNSCSEMYSGE